MRTGVHRLSFVLYNTKINLERCYIIVTSCTFYMYVRKVHDVCDGWVYSCSAAFPSLMMDVR